MSEKLMAELVDELWASFGYNTPEEHAVVIYNLISNELISEFVKILKKADYVKYTHIYLKQRIKEYEEKLK